MKALSILISLLSLQAGVALAQQRPPVPSILNATWQQYRDEYSHSPLCGKDEVTLWRCEVGQRAYALCSSQSVTRTTGYMQYRASRRGDVVFSYPAGRKPPLESFVFSTSANGDASIAFANGGYAYTLVDALRGDSSIHVAVPAGSGKDTEIGCPGNQTLQVNYTLRLVYDAGIWNGY
ncbi:hypothetical protein ACYX7E_02855 [Luteimonas sp. RIT-PG2_3]